MGTANLDNRSFRLNFELCLLFVDAGFAGEVAAMLERDFESSRRVEAHELEDRTIWFRLSVRAARLLAPVL